MYINIEEAKISDFVNKEIILSEYLIQILKYLEEFGHRNFLRSL